MNPWARRGAAAVVLGALGLFLLSTLGTGTHDTYDAGWHLLAGRIIHETGEVPRSDPICWTSGGLDWINHNWLAQVTLYRVYLAAGDAGLFALTGAVTAATLALFALCLRARGASPLLALLAVGLALKVLVDIHGLRPRALTATLLMLHAWLLARPDPEDRLDPRVAGVLVATLWLWNQVHGGFLYGYALLGLDALGTTVDARLRRGTWVTRRAQLLAGASAAGLLGFAVHPHGLDALTYALTYTDALGISMLEVTELRPLDFTTRIGRIVEGVALVGVAGALLGPRRPRAREALTLLVFLHFALTVQRGAITFLLLAAPVIAEQWTLVLDARRERLPLLTRLEALLADAWRWLPAAVGAGALAVLVVYLPARAAPGEPGAVGEAWDEALAAGPARFIRERGLPGRIFNFYSAGGLLGWATYPARRINIDGRSDLHARGDTYRDYMAVRDLQPGWKEYLDRHEVQLVVMPQPPDYLARALALEHAWPVVFADERYLVLQRPSGR